MKLLIGAIEREIEKDYIGAIEIYEEIISGSEPCLESFINLSFIYWEFAAEFSFRDLYKISDEWGDIGDKRYLEVLEKGLLKYPHSSELHFWARYFPHRLYFDKFSEKDCLEIILKFPDGNLVPYFFMYLCNTEKYKIHRNQLFEECKKSLTAKNEYIISLVS